MSQIIINISSHANVTINSPTPHDLLSSIYKNIYFPEYSVTTYLMVRVCRINGRKRSIGYYDSLEFSDYMSIIDALEIISNTVS